MTSGKNALCTQPVSMPTDGPPRRRGPATRSRQARHACASRRRQRLHGGQRRREPLQQAAAGHQLLQPDALVRRAAARAAAAAAAGTGTARRSPPAAPGPRRSAWWPPLDLGPGRPRSAGRTGRRTGTRSRRPCSPGRGRSARPSSRVSGSPSRPWLIRWIRPRGESISSPHSTYVGQVGRQNPQCTQSATSAGPAAGGRRRRPARPGDRPEHVAGRLPGAPGGVDRHQMPPTNRPGAKRCARVELVLDPAHQRQARHRSPHVDVGADRGRRGQHDARARPAACAAARSRSRPRPAPSAGQPGVAARRCRPTRGPPRPPAGRSPTRVRAAGTPASSQVDLDRRRRRPRAARPTTPAARLARRSPPSSLDQPARPARATPAGGALDQHATSTGSPGRPSRPRPRSARPARAAPLRPPRGRGRVAAARPDVPRRPAGSGCSRNAALGDQAERAVRAGEELAQVVAGDVLDDLAAGLGDHAVGAHHGDADQQVADACRSSSRRGPLVSAATVPPTVAPGTARRAPAAGRPGQRLCSSPAACRPGRS